MTYVPPELPFLEADYDVPLQRIFWSGNRNLEGCPIYHGWRFCLMRYTTEADRKWLRERGWRFSGGWWKRRNDEPSGFGKTPERHP